MSKRELNKWKNKYKLWRVLHPNTKSGCRLCNHMNRNCYKEKTLIYRSSLDKLSWSVSCQGEDKICIEWIKNV